MMIGTRIRQIRDEKGIKQDALAETIGVAIATMSRYENNSYDIPYGKILKIAKALNCSVLDLVGDDVYEDIQTTRELFVFVPIVKLNVSISKTDIAVTEEEFAKYAVNKQDLLNVDPSGLRIIVVEGDSMLPTYKDGDYALYTDCSKLSAGDLVIAVFDGNLYLRGFFPNLDGTIDLRPRSNDYLSIHISKDDPRLKLVGKVIRVYRTIKNTGFYG